MSEEKEEVPVNDMAKFWEALEDRERQRDRYRDLAQRSLLRNLAFNAVLGFFLMKESLMGWRADDPKWEIALDMALGIYFTGAAVSCFVARRKLDKPSF